MRVVTGSLKGRVIPYNPKRQGRIRLTPSALKEAVFSMIGPDLGSTSFLDLCAGCGQMGFEAVSRGANVLLNEPDPRRNRHLVALLETWGITDTHVARVPAQRLVPELHAQQEHFDVVYIDPPYHAQWRGGPLSLGLLEVVGGHPIVTPSGSVLVQHPRDLACPHAAGCLALLKQRPHGNTVLSVYGLT